MCTHLATRIPRRPSPLWTTCGYVYHSSFVTYASAAWVVLWSVASILWQQRGTYNVRRYSKWTIRSLSKSELGAYLGTSGTWIHRAFVCMRFNLRSAGIVIARADVCIAVCAWGQYLFAVTHCPPFVHLDLRSMQTAGSMCNSETSTKNSC